MTQNSDEPRHDPVEQLREAEAETRKLKREIECAQAAEQTPVLRTPRRRNLSGTPEGT